MYSWTGLAVAKELNIVITGLRTVIVTFRSMKSKKMMRNETRIFHAKEISHQLLRSTCTWYN